MHYFEFDPAPPLAAHVARYWGLAAPLRLPGGHSHQLPPDGCIAIVGVRPATGEPRVSLVGPRAEPLTLALNPGDRLWGVRFWPDAGGAVLHDEPRRLHGHFVSPLTEPAWALALGRALAACADETAAAHVADDQLAAPVAAAAPLDPLVRTAVRGLIVTNGDMEIAELARGVGLGLRQLERRFGAATGLSPLQYARIRKMRPALPHLLGQAPRSWDDIARTPAEAVRP
jgi:AraC-like DNA-binding protein